MMVFAWLFAIFSDLLSYALLWLYCYYNEEVIAGRADLADAANLSLVRRVSEMPDTAGPLSFYDHLNDQLREYLQHYRTRS